MGIVSDIEYVDGSGNIQAGCAGCELWNPRLNIRKCYAGVMTELRAGNPGWPADFSQPVIFPERAPRITGWRDLRGTERPTKPWLNGLPRIIFLDDMGDTWTESLPLDWLRQFVPALEASPHVYLFLTKRPQRMFQFFNALGRIPSNFWLGTSITGPVSEGRLEWLLKLCQIDPNVLLWLSLEPLFSYVNIMPYVARSKGALRWVVLGYESGAGALSGSVDNTRRVRDLCTGWKDWELAFFFKQWGEHKPLIASGDTAHYPRNLLTTDSAGVTWARVGKHKAGAFLDGQHWRQMPIAADKERVQWGA